MNLHWSPDALLDRREIYRYIAADDPKAARRWDQRLVARARSASRVPRSGHRVPEIEDERVLQVLLGTYRIIYRLEASVMTVLRVWEGHRLLFPEDLV